MSILVVLERDPRSKIQNVVIHSDVTSLMIQGEQKTRDDRRFAIVDAAAAIHC